MRASDADRQAVIGLLLTAGAEGRLTQAERDERVHLAEQAKTYADLLPLTHDLPTTASPGASWAPVPGAIASGTFEASSPQAQLEKKRRDLRKGWAVWLGVGVLVNVIWLGTWISVGGNPPPYWPIWVFGPWGGGMLIATLVNRAERST